MPEARRKKTMRDGSLAAGLILVIFLFIGKGVFLLLGVTVADFMMAGGLLLLVLSIKSLLVDTDESDYSTLKEISIVPLATPLIAGPAALATTLILLDSYGVLLTLCSIVLNCLCAWLMLEHAPRLRQLLGERGLKGFAKVSYILLASIGVMMIRRGIFLLK
jgi:multiple antibiotic resistance protein